MKTNNQLLKINRNFLICFLVSATLSAFIAQLLSGFSHHITTTVTIAIGYIIYFGIFSLLFYLDNKKRYQTMGAKLIKKELFKLISSFGLGEMVYLAIRWPTFYYFLEFETPAFMASLSSELISTVCYMISVTIFLRKINTF